MKGWENAQETSLELWWGSGNWEARCCLDRSRDAEDVESDGRESGGGRKRGRAERCSHPLVTNL